MNWRLQIEGWALHVAHQYRLLSQIRNPFDRLRACGELSRAGPREVEGRNPKSAGAPFPRFTVSPIPVIREEDKGRCPEQRL